MSWANRIDMLINSAQYKKAFDIAEKAFLLFPKNRFAAYHYAVALGDSEEWASQRQHFQNSRKASRILRNLLQRASGVDPSYIRAWKNEYYWFSKQPYKQWQLGVEGVKQRLPAAYYSKGVAAVSISLAFHREGKKQSAREWASRATSAWENFLKFKSNYYNAYVWYAKALGLTGDIKGMNQALRRAAVVSKRPLSYKEFSSAKKEIHAALRCTQPSTST